MTARRRELVMDYAQFDVYGYSEYDVMVDCSTSSAEKFMQTAGWILRCNIWMLCANGGSEAPNNNVTMKCRFRGTGNGIPDIRFCAQFGGVFLGYSISILYLHWCCGIPVIF